MLIHAHYWIQVHLVMIVLHSSALLQFLIQAHSIYRASKWRLYKSDSAANILRQLKGVRIERVFELPLPTKGMLLHGT